MKQALQKVRKAAFEAGKKESKKSLLPYVKKWMKRNKIASIYFINGRGFVDFQPTVSDGGNKGNGIHVFPDDFPNVKLANEFIDLCNAVGYDNGFELPDTISI